MIAEQLTLVGLGIQNVLIATDFSRCSNAALEVGLQLAKGYKAAVHIVFVVPSDEFLLAGPEAFVAAKEAARRDLDALNTELRRTHPVDKAEAYHIYLLEGDVAQSLLDFAHQKQIDIIVLGTHGRGGLGRAMLGSVAERVFRSSPIPVLTVGPGCCRPVQALAPANILVAADFSPASRRAAQYGATLARRHNSRLTLLHVLDPKQLEGIPDRARVIREIEMKLAALVGPDAPSQHAQLVEAGRVVPTIRKVAAGLAADLLVIGVRSSAGVIERLLWPNAYAIVREAPCPVLTVRESMADAGS
ncbi:MAG TPA: universal stress protein [Candidatus Binatia bacterium]|nr:universal stress protein [Candidatus Binatia bacterium]